MVEEADCVQNLGLGYIEVDQQTLLKRRSKRLLMLSGGEERRGLRCLATESGVSPDEENPCI